MTGVEDDQLQPPEGLIAEDADTTEIAAGTSAFSEDEARPAETGPESETRTVNPEREAELRDILEHNAIADAFADVAAASRDGKLATPERWAERGLVPAHMTAEDLEMMVYDHLMQWQEEHGCPEEDGASFRESDPLASQAEAAVRKKKKPSRFAQRAVGVPPAFGKKASKAAAGAPPQNSEDATSAASNREEQPSGADDSTGEQHSTIPDGYKLVELEGEETLVEADFATPEDEDADDPFAGLVIPEGYELVELEGEYVLLQTDPDALPRRREINCENVALLMGASSYYLYDASAMTGSFARWAFLAAEDNPVVTFVYCVREESRVYPRPLIASSLGNAPFNMAPEAVEQAYVQAQENADFADIARTEASNGDVYYYSTTYLEPAQADALAEWYSVERVRSV